MKAVLCLGRAGDVCNALPIAYKIYCDTGNAPGFIISKQYVDILDGISYVVPYVFDGPFNQVGRAYDQFRHQFDHVHIAQCYGSRWVPRTDSFCKDAYEQAGFGKHFNLLPVVFDRRDQGRENQLVEQYITNHPTILVNLSGHSSPLAMSNEITTMLERSWGLMANVVNLARVKCHRFYDLLGLYDKAQLLITSDTATLHMAQASPIPAIEFLVETPTPWHASVPKGNCALAIKYGDIIKRMTDVHKTIAECIL